MSEPRQHHILPAFYLAGFTDTGTRQGKLHVFDYARGRRYRARPDQVARERDFYRVYEPGYDPNVVEQDLGELENYVAPILQRVCTAGTIRRGEELGALLSLVALVHVRGLKARERISAYLEHSIGTKLEAGQVTAEQWAGLVAAEVRAGVDPATLPPFERAQQLIKEGRWRPSAPQVLKVGLIADLQARLLDLLIPHTWSLARADAAAGEFICSDTPLAWAWKNPWEPGAILASIKDPGIPITFPLSKHLALITRDDGRRGTYQAVEAVVGWVNARTHLFSKGTLYSAGEDFPLTGVGNRVGRSTDYFAYVERERRAGNPKP